MIPNIPSLSNQLIQSPYRWIVITQEQGIGAQLLLRWSQEQIQGARTALNATSAALREIRKTAAKLKQVCITPFPNPGALWRVD